MKIGKIYRGITDHVVKHGVPFLLVYCGAQSLCKAITTGDNWQYLAAASSALGATALEILKYQNDQKEKKKREYMDALEQSSTQKAATTSERVTTGELVDRLLEVAKEKGFYDPKPSKLKTFITDESNRIDASVRATLAKNLKRKKDTN